MSIDVTPEGMSPPADLQALQSRLAAATMLPEAASEEAVEPEPASAKRKRN